MDSNQLSVKIYGCQNFGKIKFFLTFSLLALFKQTQDQRDRDPPKLKQVLGRDRPKQPGNPDPVQDPSVQAREHTYYNF